MEVPLELRCPDHRQPLDPDDAKMRVDTSSVLTCSNGCRVPVVNGIPRFVDSDNYASAFGFQWNAFKKTLLDSYTGSTIFRDRLTRCLGGSLEVVRGKSVLEVGCGAGPFTEILLNAGARVFALDLSNAVEANYENNSHASNYFVCQASALSIPAQPSAFDVVLCLGVIQHTPDPEKTIASLTRYVKPGGMLVIDHYSPTYPYPLSRRILRPLLIRLPAPLAMRATLRLARWLLPLHELSLKLNKSKWRGVWRLRALLLKHSPLVDHFDDHPQLGEKLIADWSILNTHDTLTDHYKHMRSTDEIRNCLVSNGLVDLEVSYGGNGVEARARKPPEIEKSLLDSLTLDDHVLTKHSATIANSEKL